MRFYWHRAIRILPAYYRYIRVICVIAAFGIAPVSSAQIVTAALHMWSYRSVLVVTGPPQVEQTPGRFWSLALEEQFYWVWPILILLIARHRSRFLMAVILAMPVVRVVSYVIFPGLRDHLSSMFHTAIDPIDGGLACMFRGSGIYLGFTSFRQDDRSHCCFLFVVTPLMRILLRGMWTIAYGATMESAAAAALIAVLAYRSDHWTAKITRLRPFQYVGMISFSLYLWQQMFCTKGAPFESTFCISVPAALLAALVSFYAIEKPTRIWRDLFGASPSAEPIDRAAASLQE